MADLNVLTYTRDGRIAYIMLNRPDARNAIDDSLEKAIRDAIMEFDLDDEAWVAIIHGAGECFSVGADVKQHKAFAGGAQESTNAAYVEATRSDAQGGSMHLRGMSGEGYLGRTINWKPVIAAVHGFVLGGAAHLATECDLIVASEDATFAISETARGMSGGRTWAKISTFMPGKLSTEMALTGSRFSASDLYRLGLLNRLVPKGEHLRAAAELADTVLKAPPLAARAAVRLSRRQWVEPANQADMYGQALQLHLTEDFAEAGKAFKEKRKPHFKAR